MNLRPLLFPEDRPEPAVGKYLEFLEATYLGVLLIIQKEHLLEAARCFFLNGVSIDNIERWSRTGEDRSKVPPAVVVGSNTA